MVYNMSRWWLCSQISFVFTRNVSGFPMTAVDVIISRNECILSILWWNPLVLGQTLLLLRVCCPVPRHRVLRKGQKSISHIRYSYLILHFSSREKQSYMCASIYPTFPVSSIWNSQHNDPCPSWYLSGDIHTILVDERIILTGYSRY